MRISDLLSMSVASLIKRKLRTALTILGVVIGIASIVIMVSLGLGLNQQSMDMIEQYGGLTTITVNEGRDEGGSGGRGDGASAIDPLAHKLSDSTVDMFRNMEHIKSAYPVLEFQCVLKTGAYENEIYQGEGCEIEYLNSMNWEFAEGRMPKKGEALKFVYGNQILKNFNNAATGLGYYDTGVLPDINLMGTPMFTIFDTEAYFALKNSSSSAADGGKNIESSAEPDNEVKKAPKKYLVPAAGVLAGSDDDYKDYSYNIYCDIEALITTLRQVYGKKAIPGQPLRKNGKPYKEIFYSSIRVKVDSIDNMSAVQKEITDMGYEVYSNYDWIEQTREQSRSQQAMLGGIGAVSLLVAAIGIANTMMMSIYERTKEIGIMKVLGCDLSNIQQLFLLEAVLIGFIGGIAGNILSVVVSIIINTVTGNVTSLIPLWLLLLGLIFAMIVGMVAGYFPSKRAMELSPLSAIRNE